MTHEALPQSPEQPPQDRFREYLKGLEYGSPMWHVIADSAKLYIDYGARERRRGMGDLEVESFAAVMATQETQRVRRLDPKTGFAYMAAEQEFDNQFGYNSELCIELNNEAYATGNRLPEQSDIAHSYHYLGTFLHNALRAETGLRLAQYMTDAAQQPK